MSAGGTCDAASRLVAAGSVPSAVRARELLGIELLDHAEATEFPLLAVEVAVVIRITSHEPVAANVVIGFDALDHVDREGSRVIHGLPSRLSCK